MKNEELSYGDTRHALDLIIDRTSECFRRGIPREVLTVDNHVDGIYVYLRLLKESTADENPEQAERARDVLRLIPEAIRRTEKRFDKGGKIN